MKKIFKILLDIREEPVREMALRIVLDSPFISRLYLAEDLHPHRQDGPGTAFDMVVFDEGYEATGLSDYCVRHLRKSPVAAMIQVKSDLGRHPTLPVIGMSRSNFGVSFPRLLALGYLAGVVHDFLHAQKQLDAALATAPGLGGRLSRRAGGPA